MPISQSFEQFSQRLAIRAEEVGDASSRVIRRAAVAADTALVMTTPVDTGRARGNWNVSIGNINGAVAAEDFPSPGEVLATGRSVVERWKLGGGVIFIANSLPYIMVLENGSSAQAPSGMLEFGMRAAVEQFGGERLLK